MKDRTLYIESLVYDGMIGNIISKNCSDKIFHELQNKGIGVVVDLRHDYISPHLENRLKAYGIRYFRYPVHLDSNNIKYMVSHFWVFCEIIQSERFYMMGLHRSKIALCLFWTFSKATGLFPMEFYQIIRKNKRLMNKIVPILRAMVENEKHFESTENGFSADYFAERNAMIEHFIASEGPQTITYSFLTFTQYYRNESWGYDISVHGLGVLGYLYQVSDKRDGWCFDLTFPLPRSGSALRFEEAQYKIADVLCSFIKDSPEYLSLPQSVKTCISLFGASR